MDGGGEGGKEGGTFLLLLKPKSDGWMDGWTGEGGRGDERSGGECGRITVDSGGLEKKS